ncbi:hypothetical protein [Winogradskyella sp. 3972H.M.0a.05]|uniref:hypothetical protein n=1 Tax=Winogradskyella sp. 3972H.M.0a.05 TaxID=2950277 RepID=UPI0033951D42
MKNVTILLLSAFAVLSFSSCSSEDNDDSSIIGTWEISALRVGVEADINGDDIFNLNLLNEIDCNYNEVLTFDTEGLMTTMTDYNPKLDIRLNDSDDYMFAVECGEGIIGSAGAYTSEDLQNYILNGDTLTIILENEVDVYNEDFTEVIGTLTLTKVYTRQ